MSQKYTTNSVLAALVFAAVIFVLATALFWFVADFGALASLFLASLIALAAAIVLFLGFGSPAEPAMRVRPGSAPTVASSAAAAAAAATAASEATAEADRQSAAEAAAAIEARKRADAEAAAARRAAEEAEAAERAAEEAEAARKAEAAAAEAAKAEAAAAEAAEAEAAAAEAAEAEAAAAEAAKAEAAAAAEAAKAEAAAEAAKAEAAAEAAASTPPNHGGGEAEVVAEGSRPAGLDAPRDGSADDLKQIKGIGPKLEKLCNSLGFWHFDQVANWTAEEVAWVDDNLQGFKGRVTRDNWVSQAKTLASGGETEFSKRVEGGDVY